MKRMIFLTIFALGIGCAYAQLPAISLPEWNVTLRVVDEDGNPVPDANAKIWYFIQPSPEDVGGVAMTNIAGLTDGNGIFKASQHSGSIEVTCEAEKNGYYGSSATHEFAKFNDSDPAKWNPNVALVLKKISKPIPMYAKSITYITFPVFNKPIGYDLMLGDWITPYGKGINADILFKKENYEKAANDYYSKITVSFPNKGDGIQVFTVPDDEKGSALRSQHEALADGYQSELTRETSAHPGQPSKFEYDENRIYLFRVQTVLDEQGNVKSALYGKIYGDFMQFRYYLNPTPNDRNIEFDPKQNLLKTSSREPHVNAP